MEDLEEYPFSFINSPSSLMQLAATEVALTLWRYKSYSNLTFLSTGSEYKLLPITEISCEKMIAVPIPSPIRAQIDGKIDCIGRELADWVRFNSVLGLCDVDVDSEEAFSKCFEYVVLNAFCSIDFTASAINILNSGKFDDMKNYKIACALCLEDQVRRFWPSVAHDARVDRIDDDSLMSYWNRRMKSKVDSISDTLSIGERIYTTFRYSPRSVCSWAPFEYFLKIWPDHEVESRTILFLERGGHPAMKRLLPNLNRLDAEKVFEEKATEILRMLVQNDDYLQNVHQLWAVVGHTFLKYESSFVHVLEGLWKLVIYFFRSDFDLVGERVNDLLLHIWSNAPDELKVVVSSNHIKGFFENILEPPSGRSYCYQQDMTFILELLIKSSYANKEKLLRTYWSRLVLTGKPSCLEKLVRSCLPDDAAVELFKQNIFSKESYGIFNDFVKNGFYSELKNYLNFFSNSNAEFCQQLSMEVLKSEIFLNILWYDDYQFAKFDWFVNEVCLGVKNNVEEFKARLISSPEVVRCLLKIYINSDSYDLNTSINRFVTSEEKLLVVKRKLLECSCTAYPSGDWKSTVSESKWQKLLELCTPITDDAEEILAFKRSFNIDKIYLRVIWFLDRSSSLVPNARQSALSFIDIFSKWYFTNAEVERKFKLDKLKYYCEQFEFFRNMVNATEHHHTAMSELLMWFFDNDDYKVIKFSAKIKWDYGLTTVL